MQIQELCYLDSQCDQIISISVELISVFSMVKSLVLGSSADAQLKYAGMAEAGG